jgi:hypothetical protein
MTCSNWARHFQTGKTDFIRRGHCAGWPVARRGRILDVWSNRGAIQILARAGMDRFDWNVQIMIQTILRMTASFSTVGDGTSNVWVPCDSMMNASADRDLPGPIYWGVLESSLLDRVGSLWTSAFSDLGLGISCLIDPLYHWIDGPLQITNTWNNGEMYFRVVAGYDLHIAPWYYEGVNV